MGNDGIFAVDNFGIIAAFIEHTGIDSKDVCKIYRSVESAFIGTDHDKVIFINEKVIFGTQKRSCQNVGGSDIVKAAQGLCILDSGIMSVKGNEIVDAHAA